MTVSEQRHDEESPGAEHYRLSAEEMQVRVAALLDQQPPSSDDHFICYRLDALTPGREELEDVARTIERIVFEQAFNNDADDMANLYGPYETSSRFLLTVDQRTKQPVGALRIIANSPTGLMTLNTLPKDQSTLSTKEIQQHHGIESLDDCWDIGTVAVLPEYQQQGTGVSIQLYRALYISAMQNHIKHLVSVIDKKPYQTITRYLGVPFERLAGTKPFSYEGSAESVAVHGYVPDFDPKMKRPSLLRMLGGKALRRVRDPLVYGTRDDALNFDTEF